MHIWMRIALVSSGLLASVACSGPDYVDGVLEDLLEAGDLGLPHSGLPPLYTQCGRVQPGFDAGDPAAEPPIPPTLNGAPYAIEQDGFCTVSFTRLISLGDDGYARMDEHIYLVDSGEPDPSAALSTHLEDLHEQLAEGPAHYCHFRWKIDSEPLESYPEEDAQLLTYTLEEVSFYCSRAYVPGVPFVPGYQVQEAVIRSTDPGTFLFLPTDFLPPMDGSFAFQGYFGMPDTGGASSFSQPGGWMTFYEACDVEPTASGPGVCPTECRIFSPSADGSIPQCTWEDVLALPANPGLIDPDWIDMYRALFDEVQDGS